MPLFPVASGITGGTTGQFGTTIHPNVMMLLNPDQTAQNQANLQLEQLRQQGDTLRNNMDIAGQNYATDREANTNLQLGQIGADTSRRGQDFSLAQALEGYQQSERESVRGNETTRLGQQSNERIQTRGQDFDLQAALAPVNWERDRFNKVFPFFTGMADAFDSDGSAVGGANLPTPDVTVGGVYTPEQTQQQLNAGYARNAQMADTNRRRVSEGAGGRGMRADSPLLQALSAGIGAQQMGADAELGRETQLAHAKANAEQRLASEGLRGQMWAQANQGDIARRQLVQQQQNTLLMALAGMI